MKGKLLVYDLATGQVIRSWGGAAPGGSPVFRPDGARIAVFYGDRKSHTCRILDADTGRLVRSIPLPSPGKVAPGAPTARPLATPCDDSNIYVWDAATGMRKATLEGSTNRRHHCGFPPRRHTAGKQRLGIAAAALGPGPGPALAELERRIRFASSSAKTDESFFCMRTN